MKTNILKKKRARSDLAVDLEQTKEPRRPTNLPWETYKDPNHGGGLRATLIYIYIYIYTFIYLFGYIARIVFTAKANLNQMSGHHPTLTRNVHPCKAELDKTFAWH